MVDPGTNAPRRIVKLTLDEHTVIRRSQEVEQERAVAIFDLIEENHFSPVGIDGGPFVLLLKIEDNRLIFEVQNEAGDDLLRAQLALAGFRGIVKDYFMICDSYYSAIKTATRSQIEAVDMARRGLHNDGSVMLRERLADQIEIDHNTARRLFTLICVLHIRGGK
jgi:uncharacterized protein (UPF0262 family)